MFMLCLFFFYFKVVDVFWVSGIIMFLLLMSVLSLIIVYFM